MKKMEKIEKQNSLGSKLIINRGFWSWTTGIALAVTLIHVLGANISAVAGIYLGYRVLRLVMRLFGLVISTVFTAISIIILILIILLLIF